MRVARVRRRGRQRLAALEVPRRARMAHGKSRCSANFLRVEPGRALRVELAHHLLRFHNVALGRGVLTPPPRATYRALRVRGTIANLGRIVAGWAILMDQT